MMDYFRYPLQTHISTFLEEDKTTCGNLSRNGCNTGIPTMLEFESIRNSVSRPNTCRCEMLVQDDTFGESDAYFDDMESLCVLMSSASVYDDDDDSKLASKDISIDGPTESLKADPKVVYKQDADGDTLLHVAIIVTDAEKAVNFIDISPAPSLLSIQNNMFQSPLHLAVLTDQHAVARRLVVGGADMASRDKEGNTPIHIACRQGNFSMLAALIDPVSEAEKMKNYYQVVHQNVLHVLEIPNYDGLTCIHEAALHGHVGMVKDLIERGANINSTDKKSGRTLLHKASASGDEDTVKMLLSFPSCDINARAFDDTTPFDLARERGHHGITYELAKEGSQRASSETLYDS